MPNPQQFGARLKALRREQGITQSEAADRIGVARSTLASIERGHDLPGRDTLFAMATFYRVGVEFLESGAAARVPEGGDLSDDPDELALLDFWRGLDDDQRGLVWRILHAAAPRASKTA